MTSCWEKRAELRPSFSGLVQRFSTSLSTMADYFDLVVNNPDAIATGTAAVDDNSQPYQGESVSTL